MTRASTPASFSTSTAIVAARMSLSVGSGMDPGPEGAGESGRDHRAAGRKSSASDEDLALVRDAGDAAFLLRPQDHLVMRRAGRDHREAVFLLVHRDVGDDGLVDRDHLPDHAIEV